MYEKENNSRKLENEYASKWSNEIYRGFSTTC